MDTFQTIAEIAATFVGLAGIVVAVSTKGDQYSHDNTLLGIFAAALGALFFALFPELLIGRFPESDNDWRLVCGIFGVVHLILAAPAAFRSSTRTTEELVLVVLSQPSIWLKITVGAGFLVEHSYQIYLFGLMWMLGVSMFYFVRYVLRLSGQIGGDA